MFSNQKRIKVVIRFEVLLSKEQKDEWSVATKLIVVMQPVNKKYIHNLNE